MFSRWYIVFFFKGGADQKQKKKRNEKINIVKPLESQAPLIYIHALWPDIHFAYIDDLILSTTHFKEQLDY